jgi:hypothetical protein
MKSRLFESTIVSRQMSLLLRCLALAGALAWGACSTPSAGDFKKVFEPTVMAARDSGRTWELALRYSFMAPPQPGTLAVMHRKIDGTFWFYLPTVEGTISAENVVLTLERGRLSEPYTVADLKGTIEFKAKTMVIALEVPEKKDGRTITSYQPFVGNGTYQLDQR